MSKDKANVAEMLRAKIAPENRIFVKKNLAISDQVEVLLSEKGWSQKELAQRMGKSESEISKWLSGLHNLTLKSIAKLEAELGSEIITTPIEACKKYRTTEFVTLKVYIPYEEPFEELISGYIQESKIEYQKTYQKMEI